MNKATIVASCLIITVLTYAIPVLLVVAVVKFVFFM